MEKTVTSGLGRVNSNTTTHPDTTSLVIRSPDQRDIPALIAIEDRAHNYPWPDATLHWAITQKKGFTRVLELQQTLIGFAIFECVLDEASLLNIAIDPERQHQGLGRYLLDACIAGLEAHITRVLLEVRASNYPAQRLYQAMGFNEIGIRKDYYPTFTGRENAHVMELRLPVTG